MSYSTAGTVTIRLRSQQSARIVLAICAMSALLCGCFVDFDVANEGPWACTSDRDCVGSNICVIAEGEARGACQRSEEPPDDICDDEDGDGYGIGPACRGFDCDDNDPNVHPGAFEFCDGKDNNCECLDEEGNCTIEVTTAMVDEPNTCTTDDDCDVDPERVDSDTTIRDLGRKCIIDEGQTEGICMYRCPLDTIGVCAGAVRQCEPTDNGDGTWTPTLPDCQEIGAYGPDYLDVDEDDEPCDDLDNNCNGETDMNENCVACDPNNLRTCSNNFGICRQGIQLCNEDGTNGDCVDPDDMITPVPTPMDEVCDGLDNDCDGTVDNAALGQPAGSVCDNGCPFNMVLVIDPNGAPPNNEFCIDRYEASRPDATDVSAGSDDMRAVSRPNVLPWTGLTASAARNACRGPAGNEFPTKELCSPAQMELACMSDMALTYPYGNAYDGASCNTVDNGAGTVVPTGSIAACATMSVDERPVIFDLSGNVEEFALIGNDPRLFGGSFQSGEAEATCSSERNGQGQMGPQIGFRCCIAPQN